MSDDRPRILRDHFDETAVGRRRARRDERDSEQADDSATPLGDGGSDSIDGGPDLTDDITGDAQAGSGDVMDGVTGVAGTVLEVGAILQDKAVEGAGDIMEAVSNAADRAGEVVGDAIQTAQVLAGGDNPWASGGSSGEGDDGGDDDGDDGDGDEASGGDIISELDGEAQLSTAAGGIIAPEVALVDDDRPLGSAPADTAAPLDEPHDGFDSVGDG